MCAWFQKRLSSGITESEETFVLVMSIWALWPLVPDDSLRTELEIKNTLGCVRAWATVCVVGLGVACKVQGWVVTALGGFSKTWLCEWGRDAREYAARG